MSRVRARLLARWALEAMVLIVIVGLYLLVFSRGQILHGSLL